VLVDLESQSSVLDKLQQTARARYRSLIRSSGTFDRPIVLDDDGQTVTL